MNDRFRFRAYNRSENYYIYDAIYAYDGNNYNAGGDNDCHIRCLAEYMDRPDEYIVEQCTGLKDKNGRLVYEGDIVKAEVEEPERKVIGIITFGRYVHDLGFYVHWKGAPAELRKYCPGWRQDLFYWLEEESLEVIGNIHENPDLLEDENA